MTRLTPLPPAPTELCYELVNVSELPMIDISRSIKSALCSTRSVGRITAVMRTSRRVVAVLHAVSMPFDTAMFFVPAPLGRWCALTKITFQGPLLVFTIASLRTDMIVSCLMHTYEFWFISITIVASCVALCARFSDFRAIACVYYGFGLMTVVCVDANLASRQLAVLTFVYIPYQLLLLLAVSMDLTPETHCMTLLSYKRHTVTTDDFLVNALTIVTVLMLRTAYRKRQFLNQPTNVLASSSSLSATTSSTITRCVVYRCRVKLQLYQPKTNAPTPHTVSTSCANESRAATRATSVAPTVEVGLQQLRYSSNRSVYLESDIVSPCMLQLFRNPSERAHRCRVVALYAAGICGLVFNLFPFLEREYSFQGNRNTASSVFALTCTLSFVGVFVSCYNRKLLRELVCSFDFCILSLQLSIVHVLACDVFYWDGRCYFVLFNWLAMHWVLTLDALTPTMRRGIGLSVRVVIPFVVFFVLAIVRVSLDMVVFVPSRPFQDRVLLSTAVFGHRVEFRVGPLFLNRGWTLLLWSFRLLWRLCTSGEDDRIIIQGNVDFVANRRTASIENFQRRATKTSHRSTRAVSVVLTKAAQLKVLARAQVHPATASSRWAEPNRPTNE